MPDDASREGRLPDFIIVGTQKGGTTSLQHHLRKHPRIEMAPNLKGHPGDEPHFFDRHYDRGVEWYRSLFRDNGKLQGEKTPKYLSAHVCHARLHALVPRCKLVAILREPVARAESAFNHAIHQSRIRGVTDVWGWNTAISFEANLNEYREGRSCGDYVIRGCYIDHLESLLRFFPREQLLVLISEEYRRDPAKTLGQLFEFLGVEPAAIPYNPAVHRRPRGAMISEPSKAWLRDYYAPFNRRLFAFLGREIRDWMGG